MLPDLRIVIAAVISTFVLTVGVGFYASSRLISEPKRSADSLAAFEETPVNRIALSWPEPTRQPEPLALDFAVTAKALRNPVREITNEMAPAEAPDQPIRTSATDLALPPSEKPTQATPARIEPSPAPIEAAVGPAVTDPPKPEPEPEIRVAVQYPALELPPELRAPSVPVAPLAAPAPTPADGPATTGFVPEQPKAAEPIDPPSPVTPQPQTKIASRPDPAEASNDDPELEQVIPKPRPTPSAKAKKATPKKAPIRRPRVVRRNVQPALPAVPTTFPWNFFGTRLPN